jgi:hypothetical protein
MPENLRRFEAVDLFGRVWQVEFRWHQNAISIRHGDAVDCKYYLSCGEERREFAIALPLADLERVARARGRSVSDAWCMRLAALHLRGLIEEWRDMERKMVVVSPAELDRLSLALQAEDGAAAPGGLRFPAVPA